MSKYIFKDHINYTQIFSVLDWIIFIIIIIITILSIIWGHKLKKIDNKTSTIEILLMGRQLTLPMFIATLVATWYGGIFGVTKIAFEQGVFNFITQGFFWYISYLIFAFFLINKISPYQAVTLPDLVNKMFGPKSSKLSAIFNFFNVLPIAYSISIGLFLQIIFGGALWINIFAGTTFVVLYSLIGGFRAVVFSDLVQFFVMCLAVLIVLCLSHYHFGGISFLQSNLPKSYFTFTGNESVANTILWGLIALSTLVDPNFYQRCFAAKSTTIAKRGIIYSTMIWVVFDLCTTAGAMYAKAIIPQAKSSQAYIIYALQLLPNGLRGFFMAGILATILSTLDSYLFLAGTTLSYDLAPKKMRNKKKTHYIGIILVGVISIVMAQLFNGNIKAVWKTLGSYSASCLLLPMVWGYLRPGKITDNQFFTASIIGVISTTYWRQIDRIGVWENIDEIYIGCFCTFLSLIIYPVVQKVFKITK
jgi:solute:Na+ symporter, SSS family